MISFMIHQVSWTAVFIAACVGFVMSFVWHMILGPLFYRFEHAGCKKECGTEKSGMKKEEHCCCEHAHCRMGAMLWHRFGLFVVFFVQAYGLGYLLERFNVLGDLVDAIYLALFVGATFMVSQLFCKVLHHHKSLTFFIFKAAYKLFVLSLMAWVFVYWASMGSSAA